MQAAPPRHFLPIHSPLPAIKPPPVGASISYHPRRSAATTTIASAAISASAPALIPPAIERRDFPATSVPALIPPAIERRDFPATDDSAATAFWDYQMLFLSQRSETTEPIGIRVIDGAIPADFPRGTYYLTGPGIFADDHGSTLHPLDGHGYLRAFEFAGGGAARYSAKYVDTAAAREEKYESDAGAGGWRFTHRGPFSVLKGGKRVGNLKVMKNVANTAVVRWGRRLMCLWEGGDPYEIDARTMETIGPVDLIGGSSEKERSGRRRGGGGGFREAGVDLAAALLRPVLHGIFKMPAKRLLSHYKIDEKRNRLLILSCNAEDMLLPRSNFTFYEFDEKFEQKQKKEFIIPDHLMIHDWAFTDNHYILFGNRIKLDLQGSMLAVCGLSPMISALSLNPSQSKTPIYLLPRFESPIINGQRDWRVPIEAPSQLWISHIANAFEEGDGGGVNIQIQASACSYQWFDFQKMFGYNWKSRKLDPSFMNDSEGNKSRLPHLVRVSIKLDQSGGCRSCSVANSSSSWSWPADFPTINDALAGQRNKFMYAGTASGTRRFLPHFPYDSVVKLNCFDGTVTSWCAGKRKFIGEPIFVARGEGGGEDDGYILVVEYLVSKLRCNLVILDAKRIGRENAIVARLEVPKNLYFPLGFHGFWDNKFTSDAK